MDKDERMNRIWELADQIKWVTTITKPIMSTKLADQLSELGALPTPFISYKVGSADILFTKDMVNPKLKKYTCVSVRITYDPLYPEKPIIDLIKDYCSHYPSPDVVLKRIKKALRGVKHDIIQH